MEGHARTATTEQPNSLRQAFLDACAPHTKRGHTDEFIRGWYDQQCGRPASPARGVYAAEAYLAGRDAYAGAMARKRIVAGKVDRPAAPKVRNPAASTNELATDIASAGGAA